MRRDQSEPLVKTDEHPWSVDSLDNVSQLNDDEGFERISEVKVTGLHGVADSITSACYSGSFSHTSDVTCGEVFGLKGSLCDVSLPIKNNLSPNGCKFVADSDVKIPKLEPFTSPNYHYACIGDDEKIEEKGIGFSTAEKNHFEDSTGQILLDDAEGGNVKEELAEICDLKVEMELEIVSSSRVGIESMSSIEVKSDFCTDQDSDGKSIIRRANAGYLDESHTKEKPLKCNLCDKKFVRLTNLKNHLKTHTGETPFICGSCGAKFTTRSNLKSHEMSHSGEKQFQCDICSAKFVNNSGLIYHQKNHLGQKDFKCKHCGAKFTQKADLVVHERIHTGEKPFVCIQCNAAFVCSSYLKKHERRHSGAKPFECKHCGAKFTQKQELTIHERLHTGEKPFECKLCNAAYVSSSSLSKHEKTHSGEKPFKCRLCSAKFARHTHLKSHEKIHPEDTRQK